MAIGLKDVQAAQTAQYAAILTEENLAFLEAEFDRNIILNVETKKSFFGQRIKTFAYFSYLKKDDNKNPPGTKNIRELFMTLIISGNSAAFMERYKQQGWTTAKCWIDFYGNPCFEVLQIISPSKKTIEEVNTLESNKAEKLRVEIAKKRAELYRLEAEFEMLTESPNSRDPLLLPETAGKSTT